MIIGAHCKNSSPNYLLGSVQEALSYQANALMIYTGAPQNTRRKDISLLKIDEAHQLMSENNIPLENMIIHAPYIINLANSVKPETYELATKFLRQEIDRVIAIKAKYLVLHPGSFTTADLETGIQTIIRGLNEVLKPSDNIIICLETMAGKGSEVGYRFEHLKQIINQTTLADKLGVCLDTCHIHDAGYDLNNFDDVLDEFDQVIGLDRLKVLHINDSKNIRGARKDRHANIGAGEIGLTALKNICNNPRTKEMIKILETPYIDKNSPYKQEIELLKQR